MRSVSRKSDSAARVVPMIGAPLVSGIDRDDFVVFQSQGRGAEWFT